MKTSHLLASFTLMTATTIGIAAAQPAYPPASLTVETPTDPRHHSINVSPLGLVGGGFNANYEYLRGQHGFVAEIGTTSWSSTYKSTVNGVVVEDESIEGRHATVGLGYRWHIRSKQNSLFLGAMLHQNLGTADIHNVDNGVETMDKDIAYRSTTLTATVGKRWMLSDHVNITLRVGLGVAERKVIDDDANEMAKAELQDTIEFPLAADGELSLGWTF
jgi:hypothetical protein